MTESERALRVELVRFAKQMITTGLVRGTSGNISAREPGADRCLITPSGVDYDTMKPEDLVLVGLNGERDMAQAKPSVSGSSSESALPYCCSLFSRQHSLPRAGPFTRPAPTSKPRVSPGCDPAG